MVVLGRKKELRNLYFLRFDQALRALIQQLNPSIISKPVLVLAFSGT
jgi:hypothetical protein